MKKIYYLLMMLVAVIGLGSCADDDDTPQLTSSTTMVLNKLPVDSINQLNTNYTFSWSPARFYLDGNQEPTGVGSYEYGGVKYTVQMDVVGGDFSNAQELASTIGIDNVNVTYDDIVSKVAALTGQKQDQEEHTFDLQFRVKAQYGSDGLDSASLYSNVITEPFKMTIKTVPEGPAPRLFICDEAGYGALALYAWHDGGDVKDPWPGIQPSGTVDFNGKTYYQFDLSSEYYSEPVNFIVNNNGGGSQIDLMQGYQITEDTYLTINADGTYTVYEAPQPKIYVHSDLGWSEYHLYAWRDGGDIKDPWPGIASSGTVNINGEDWEVFQLTKEYTSAPGNYIINNNNGTQQDILTGEQISNDVFVRIAADGTYTESAGPILDDNNHFTIYANLDGASDWNNALAFYVWGDAEQTGGWPGAVANGPLNINGKNYYYHTFTKGGAVNVILNNNGGGNQCADITDQTSGVYNVYTGNKAVKQTGF